MNEMNGAEHIISVMDRKGYKVFNNPKGHDLNIVGIRTKDMTSNRFNDWLTVFYISDGQWNFFPFPCTTDPGTYYRTDPINVKGTAIMKSGQYRGLWKVGKHKGYKALQQKNPCTVYRDANLDAFLDTKGIKQDTGLFGINCHRSNAGRASTRVDKWSAGCQVLQDPDHFVFLMALCDRAAGKFGNSFTYTLLTHEDFRGRR